MACITLLSDLGLLDASVGGIKGILLQHVPTLPVIDISHDVQPYHLQQAAYLLHTAYQSFPAGSFHLVLCDTFYVAAPRVLLCCYNGHYFIAPDNGVLSLALQASNDGVWECRSSESNTTLKSLVTLAADTVHKLQTGTEPAALGFNACEMRNTLVHWEPKLTGNSVECHIIHIDRFENVIINITRQQFEEYRQGRNFRIQFFLDAITAISDHYADVKKGEMLCRFNSAGYLEIAINKDKAASLLGMKLNKEQHLIYKAIKIVFE